MLLKEFLSATSSGQLWDLVALLSDDVVLYSDGGGRASAALNPIYGRDHISRFVFGAIRNTVPADVITRLEEINGRPSIIYSPPDGRAGCVVTFDIVNGLIQNISVVTNPEKLLRLPKLAV
jgi:RNA polymerase sigma-70 factor (ECF subfamily)